MQYELDGRRFGRWTVLKRARHVVRSNGQKISRWLCRCDCGNEVIVLQNSLINGSSSQCSERAKHTNRLETSPQTITSLSPNRSLAHRSPALAKEWHPTKNGKLLPAQVTAGSGKKVWWLCAKNHEYEAIVVNRRKSGCPFCGNRKIGADNSLAIRNPQLAAEWHPSKNNTLTPSDVPPSGARRVWWRCSEGHDWQQSVNQRDCGSGCPFCDGKQVAIENSFQSKFPDLANQWHPTKNGSLLPSQVTSRSGRNAWWICVQRRRNHGAFLSRIADRADGRGCPKCKNQTSIFELRLLAELETIFSRVEHRHKIDGNECDIYLPQIKLPIEIDGNYFHKDRINEDREKNARLQALGFRCLRLRGHGLVKLAPEDIQLTKAQEVKPDHSIISKVVSVIKLFTVDKEILESIDLYLKATDFKNQIRFNTLVLDIANPAKGRALSDVAPELLKEWHPKKNHPLQPSDVSYGSSLEVWWQCKMGHDWKIGVSQRVAGNNCPYCSGYYASPENNLAVLSPQLAKEWHPTKNEKVTPDSVTPNSNKVFWWQCIDGHEWEARPNDRSSKGGTKCPYCSGRRVSSDHCLAAVSPKLAKEWHPTKNGALTPLDVFPSTAKPYWWECEKGHVWEESPNSRENRGCPFCSKKRLSKEYSLAIVSPKLAKEWHPTKNGKITPADIFPSSGKKVWWQCKNGHEWLASPNGRSKTSACPSCP